MSTLQLERGHHWCFGENSELLFHPDKNQAQIPIWHYISTDEIPVGALIASPAITPFPYKPCLKTAL